MCGQKKKDPYRRRFAWVKVLPFREQAGENSRDDDLLNVRRRRLLPFPCCKTYHIFLALSSALCRILPPFTSFYTEFTAFSAVMCALRGLTKAQKADILLLLL